MTRDLCYSSISFLACFETRLLSFLCEQDKHSGTMKKKIMKEGNKSLQDKTEKELKVKNDKKFMFFP